MLVITNTSVSLSSGEFDIELGGDQTIQNFSANSLVDTCAATQTNGLWEFIVYQDEAA